MIIQLVSQAGRALRPRRLLQSPHGSRRGLQRLGVRGSVGHTDRLPQRRLRGRAHRVSTPGSVGGTASRRCHLLPQRANASWAQRRERHGHRQANRARRFAGAPRQQMDRNQVDPPPAVSTRAPSLVDSRVSRAGPQEESTGIREVFCFVSACSGKAYAVRVRTPRAPGIERGPERSDSGQLRAMDGCQTMASSIACVCCLPAEVNRDASAGSFLLEGRNESTWDCVMRTLQADDESSLTL